VIGLKNGGHATFANLLDDLILSNNPAIQVHNNTLIQARYSMASNLWAIEEIPCTSNWQGIVFFKATQGHGTHSQR
jgi:hypothetical protein